MWNARLDESQAGIKIAGRNFNNLRYADDTTLMTENEGELKTLLMKVKEERVKAGLKYNIQKTKIIASGPNTLWEIRGGKKNGQWQTFYFLGSKITADSDCGHEMNKHFLFESYDKPRQQIKKQRRNFANKDPNSQSCVFSRSHVWMFWTIKKAECQRIVAFKPWS